MHGYKYLQIKYIIDFYNLYVRFYLIRLRYFNYTCNFRYIIFSQFGYYLGILNFIYFSQYSYSFFFFEKKFL